MLSNGPLKKDKDACLPTFAPCISAPLQGKVFRYYSSKNSQLHRDPIPTTNVLRPPLGRIKTFSAPCSWYVSILGTAIEPIVTTPVIGRAVIETFGKGN